MIHMRLIDQSELVLAENDHEDWKLRVFPYYTERFCLREVSVGGPKQKTITDAFEKFECHVGDRLEDFVARKPLCVLPIGHTGKCCGNFSCVCPVTKSKLNYITVSEGESEGPLKNRISRLFPIRLSKKTTSIFKKLGLSKVAVPVSNSTTPEGMATCLIDIYTYIQKVKGDGFEHPIFEDHWKHMSSMYPHMCRDDVLVCPVTGDPVTMHMLGLNARENEDGIEIGHLDCRCEHRFTIRGMNVFLMTRKGNRLVGEHRFDSNEFREDLIRIGRYGT